MKSTLKIQIRRIRNLTWILKTKGLLSLSHHVCYLAFFLSVISILLSMVCYRSSRDFYWNMCGRDLISFIISSSLLQHFSCDLINIEIFRIRALLNNEWIVFPNPSPRRLIDTQQGRNLVFFIKQHAFGLTFSFTSFFIEIF